MDEQRRRQAGTPSKQDEGQIPARRPEGGWYGTAGPEFSEGRAGQREPGEEQLRKRESHGERSAQESDRRRTEREAKDPAPDPGDTGLDADPADDDGLLQTREVDGAGATPPPPPPVSGPD